MATPDGIYDLAAHEAFCTELIGAGFSPVADTNQTRWVGPLPAALEPLTQATEAFLQFPDGWPVVAARFVVPGLVADHVTHAGYVCLWADDDPAQSSARTLPRLLERLENWASSAQAGFELQDQALDSWAFFDRVDWPAAEIDLPSLLANSSNGLKRAIHGKRDRFWTFSRAGEGGHDLEGVLFFRSSLAAPPRSLRDFSAKLTRGQRDNLEHGLKRRADVGPGERSGGYDFAILAWPRYGHWDALLISFEGAGESLAARAHRLYPSDVGSRLKRAGPHARELETRRVLVVGAGSVGSQVALLLATSGVGRMTVSDNAQLRTVNLARHAVGSAGVGYQKSIGATVRIEDAAPWCEVETGDAIEANPYRIPEQIDGFDLVVDCTGTYATTLALSDACRRLRIPLVSVALFSAGAIARVRRQDAEDPALYERTEEAGYPAMPVAQDESFGFLELGCTSPVHNAPPTSVARLASDGAACAIDLLSGRKLWASDVVTVLNPVVGRAPFDRLGSFTLPLGD